MKNLENILNRITEVEYYAGRCETGKKCLDFPQTLVNDIKYILNKQNEEIELLKAQQPKKGHWQPYKYGDDTWHQCSACGVADRYIDIVRRDGYPDYRMVSKRNFCPNCGADMRENETN